MSLLLLPSPVLPSYKYSIHHGGGVVLGVFLDQLQSSARTNCSLYNDGQCPKVKISVEGTSAAFDENVLKMKNWKYTYIFLNDLNQMAKIKQFVDNDGQNITIIA